MYREWPFFAALLSNLDMVLAKTDLHIAERYVELVPDAALVQRIFAAIRLEWQDTQEMLTLITGESDRLSNNPALARSIAHRFPYIDLLNHLQPPMCLAIRVHCAQQREFFARRVNLDTPSAIFSEARNRVEGDAVLIASDQKLVDRVIESRTL